MKSTIKNIAMAAMAAFAGCASACETSEEDDYIFSLGFE